MSGLLVSSGGGGNILFDMDYSSGAFRDCGWETSIDDTTDFTMTRIAGGGPSGQDVIQLQQHANGAVQFYWGHGSFGGIGTDPTPFSSTRVVRLRLRIPSDVNFLAADGASSSTTKFIMFADGAGTPPVRFILYIHGNHTTGNTFQLAVQYDAVSIGMESGYIYSTGTWYDVQWELKGGSSLSATDGWMKLWVNNNTYASPDMAVTGIQAKPQADDGGISWARCYLGSYQNEGLNASGVYKIQHCDFEIGDAFDSGWH